MLGGVLKIWWARRAVTHELGVLICSWSALTGADLGPGNLMGSDCANKRGEVACGVMSLKRWGSPLFFLWFNRFRSNNGKWESSGMSGGLSKQDYIMLANQLSPMSKNKMHTNSKSVSWVVDGARIKPGMRGWATDSDGKSARLALKRLFPVHLSLALSSALDNRFLVCGHVRLCLEEAFGWAKVLPQAHSCQLVLAVLPSDLCIIMCSRWCCWKTVPHTMRFSMYLQPMAQSHTEIMWLE